MPSITNSGIVTTYNSRGLITHNANTRPLVRLSDGTLIAIIRENKLTAYLNLYRSTDNGFTWRLMWMGTFASPSMRKTGYPSHNHNGPFMHLAANENAGTLILWHSYGDQATGKFNVQPFVFDLNTLEPITQPATDWPTQHLLDMDELSFDMVYNQNAMFLVFVTYGNLRVNTYSPVGLGNHTSTRDKSGDFFNVLAADCDHNGNVDILVIARGSPFRIQHFRYSQAAANFTGPHDVHRLPGQTDAFDLSLSRDGYGNMLAVWSQHNTAGDDVEVKYSMSEDNGTNWSAAKDVPREPDQVVFKDFPTGKRAARSNSIAGIRGFLITYVTQDSDEDGVARAWVRQLKTEDGEEYTLEAAQRIGSQAAENEDITGVRFFHPPSPMKLDITDPGQVRIAYQIGQGNSTVQNDTVPVRIGQELLRESAYPMGTPPSDRGGYEEDPISEDEPQVLVRMNILGGPAERADYFGLGLVGHATMRYLSAFQKVGIETKFLRYEPMPFSEMSDRSSYHSPFEVTVKVVMDPQTYEMPLAPRGVDTHNQFMQRDVRAVYLPPNFFLDRTSVVNRGGKLKRTIWTLLFDGNEYEVTQVIPYFIDGVIAYYKANAYVVGPANDPFAKIVLPSES